MNTTDRISKEVLNVLEFSKETLKSNIVSANSSNVINLTNDQLESVVNLINVSFSQGFQKALPSFQKKVESLIEKRYDEVLSLGKKK